MSISLTSKVNVIANSGATLLARVRRSDGANMVAADVSTFVVKVYDASGNLTATLANGAHTVYSSLQTDTRWVKDTTGYNVSIDVPGSSWTTAQIYRVEAKITPTTGNAFFLLWDCD